MSPEAKPPATAAPAVPAPAPTAPAQPPQPAAKSYLPTSQTGLQDYSFWWEYARKQAKTTKTNPAYRRGRIWT